MSLNIQRSVYRTSPVCCRALYGPSPLPFARLDVSCVSDDVVAFHPHPRLPRVNGRVRAFPFPFCAYLRTIVLAAGITDHIKCMIYDGTSGCGRAPVGNILKTSRPNENGSFFLKIVFPFLSNLLSSESICGTKRVWLVRRVCGLCWNARIARGYLSSSSLTVYNVRDIVRDGLRKTTTDDS